jgi:RNA polymerase sigma factor (sigma-70 family)
MDRGDRFSELYRSQYEAVLRYALRRTDPDTARDVVAETFLVAWRRPGAVPADPGQAGPWLYGVARRVLANADRSRRRLERVTTRLGQERLPGQVPDIAGAVAERARLERALTCLTASDQEALRLVGWEELDLAEAALAMGCSRPAMAVRLHRARRRLVRALETADRGEGTLAERPGTRATPGTPGTPGRNVSQEAS